MTAYPLYAPESAVAASILCYAINLCGSPESLRFFAEINADAIQRLSESDRESVRAAYRAKRDELTGARQ